MLRRALTGSGSDTVSNTLSFAFFHLSRHPEVLEKVYSELKKVTDDPLAIPTVAQLDGLPYFRGVVQEGASCGLIQR